MTYTLTSSSLAANAQPVVRDADGARIPADPRNADFQQYLAWLGAGNTPTPYTAPAPPPPALTFLQFMALFTAAEQAAIVASSDVQTKLFLMMATGAGTITLNNPEVISGVNYLATATTATPPGPGLIAAARATAILDNQAPASS